MYIKTLTVSALNSYIKKVIDNDFILNNTYIKGEISNFKLHTSGHAYFSIKDESSKLSCVMFKAYTSKLNFLPEDGMKVVIKGKVSVYQKDGTYQLYCEEIKAEGLGDLYLAFQKLKEKLEKEGLFELKYKKALPKYPSKIGIITSPTGAAIRDIINVIKRRNSTIDLLIYPALVQGINASEDIIKGIEVLNATKDVDVIILARGGGSIEELWSFNDEKLAYAIFNSKKPIITGVGHEVDFTIVDYVGDLRAPTPSAAAELAVPSLIELKEMLINNKTLIETSANTFLIEKFNHLQMLKRTLELKSPENYIINQYNHIYNLKELLDNKIYNKVLSEKDKLGKFIALLNAHNPLNVLNKGYSIITDNKDKVINSTEAIRNQEVVNIRLKDGKIKMSIREIN
jgi:exodeoxyribonuclease VII large subunit